MRARNLPAGRLLVDKRAGRHTQHLTPDSVARTRRRSKLWYALIPDATTVSASQLAEICLSVSDYVSLVSEDKDEGGAVLVEISTSLRYFGGLRALVAHLNHALTTQAGLQHYQQALSPSPSASLLLARVKPGQIARQYDDLRSVLGDIAVESLPVPVTVRRAIQRCGLLTLRDLWRIPPDQLRLRFGRELYKHLQCLTAVQQEVPTRWHARRSFRAHVRFDDGLLSTQQILHHANRLLPDLISFLKQHHLQCEQIGIRLLCETPPPLLIILTTRHAGRDAELFNRLLSLRLEHVKLNSPVLEIELTATELFAFNPGQVGQASALTTVLAARLGNNSVQQLAARPEYAPELATLTAPWNQGSPCQAAGEPAPGPCRFPSFLLEPPQRLRLSNNVLFYRGALEIIDGPYRIESQWWSEHSLRRDYYVARNPPGSQLWVFQDIGRTKGWFLQGVFA